MSRICLRACVIALAAAATSCSESQNGTRLGFNDRSADNAAVVLLSAGFAGSWPTGLDPATNATSRANLSIMNAIFGGLFQLASDPGGEKPEVVGVLADTFWFEDSGRRLVIRLRPDLFFSDGTPLNAEAVEFNILRNRDITCSCFPSRWPWDPAEPVTVRAEDTVVLNFSRSYLPAINSFPVTNINWIISPTAVATLSAEELRLRPVGAGPFIVDSNQPSNRIVLKRNPGYWEKGKPFLDRLEFQAIGGEQAALQALLSGDADAYEGMSSVLMIEEASSHEGIQVTTLPATSTYMIQINTATQPFDNKAAREAIYYATDVEAIRKGVIGDRFSAAQSFTGPGGLFFVAGVPGYRAFDQEKARRIVEDLGPFSVQLSTLRNFVAEQIVTALQQQWAEVGIQASIETHDVASLNAAFEAGTWQAMLQVVGSYDPEAGVGVAFRFDSGSLNSGVRDEALDDLLFEAASGTTSEVRHRLYLDVSEYISEQAYAPFLFAFAPTQVTVDGLIGPGLTSSIPPISINAGVWWQEVRWRDVAQGDE